MQGKRAGTEGESQNNAEGQTQMQKRARGGDEGQRKAGMRIKKRRRLRSCKMGGW